MFLGAQKWNSDSIWHIFCRRLENLKQLYKSINQRVITHDLPQTASVWTSCFIHIVVHYMMHCSHLQTKCPGWKRMLNGYDFIAFESILPSLWWVLHSHWWLESTLRFLSLQTHEQHIIAFPLFQLPRSSQKSSVLIKHVKWSLIMSPSLVRNRYALQWISTHSWRFTSPLYQWDVPQAANITLDLALLGVWLIQAVTAIASKQSMHETIRKKVFWNTFSQYWSISA